MAEKTKKAFVNKDFNDAGTNRQFTASVAGKPDTLPEIEEGAFLNYLAAGLVREPTADDKKATSQAA
jgi:hypothetical protein